MVIGAATPRYRGRDGEMQVLEAAMDDAASGRLAAVIVEGEAGIGKSRLLWEALASARDRGLHTVAGRAEELERTRPFAVLVDALECSASSSDPRRAAIGDLLATRVGDRGATTVTSDPGLRFQGVDAFVDLVDELALRRPLVIGLDDLQWADHSSLLTLDALGRRLPYVAVALIVCIRPTPRSADLERMVGTLVAAGARRLRLSELGDQAVTDLVAEIVGTDPSPGLMAEVSAAGGNPLFVTELVRALVEEGAIQTDDGRADVAEMILPPSLRLTILQRLSALSADTLDLLRSASVLGSGFTLAELSTVTTKPAFELSVPLDEAFRSHVLTDDDNRVRFRHDLIREAIYADLPHSVRVGLHRDAGERLSRSGASAMRVAEHMTRGAESGDADAVGWLIAAAHEAAPASPGIAADLIERAIGLTEPSDAGRDKLLAERAETLMWAGRIAEAEAACRSLLDRPHDPAVEPETRACLARCLMTGGRMREALRELEAMQQSPALTDLQRIRGWAWAGFAHLSLGDLDDATTLAEQARSAADADDMTTSLAFTILAVVKEFRASLPGALEMIDEGVRRADRSPERRGHRYPMHATRGHILLELERFGEARATFETGMRISEGFGAQWPLSTYRILLALERFVAGEWDDAIAEFESGVDLAEETGERYSLVLGHSVMSLIALHRNDLPSAAQAASVAAREVERSGPRYRSHWSAWVRARLLEADGAVAEAFTTLAACWDQCASSGLAIEYPLLGPDLVRLAVAAGEHRRASQAARAVAAVAADNDVSSLTGAALRCRGLCDGNPDTLRAAVDAYAESPRPLERAFASEDAGAALGRAGDVDAAVPLLDSALKIYDQLDAARDIARTHAMLRSLGIHRGRRGGRKRPRTGWASLTPTERTVAALVAEGLSNREAGDRLFVSRRTVQTHLAHIFAKLQISSRTELAAAVARRTRN